MATARATEVEASVRQMSPELRDVLAKFFQALADPTRLALVAFLLEGEHTQSECVEHVGLAQSRVSTHLACLVDCGYVGVRREGRFSYYSVVDPRIVDILVDARAMVADNAAALAACTRIPETSDESS